MAAAVKHVTASELEAGLEEITRSPKDEGVLEMIVRRPQVGERESSRRGSSISPTASSATAGKSEAAGGRPTARRIPTCSSI